MKDLWRQLLGYSAWGMQLACMDRVSLEMAMMFVVQMHLWERLPKQNALRNQGRTRMRLTRWGSRMGSSERLLTSTKIEASRTRGFLVFVVRHWAFAVAISTRSAAGGSTAAFALLAPLRPLFGCVESRSREGHVRLRGRGRFASDGE